MLQVLKDLQDRQVPKEIQVLKDPGGLLEQMVPLDHKVMKDRLDPGVQLEQRLLFLDQLDLQVLQESRVKMERSVLVERLGLLVRQDQLGLKAHKDLLVQQAQSQVLQDHKEKMDKTDWMGQQVPQVRRVFKDQLDPLEQLDISYRKSLPKESQEMHGLTL
jgi:hypothetical protein